MDTKLEVVVPVNDIDAARAELVEHGVDVSEVFHDADGVFHHGGTNKRVPGPGRDHASYGSFASFSDSDGNTWYLQEVTTRLPGLVDPSETTFASTDDLAAALRRAAKAHGEHEEHIGAADANWPDWYADYLVREQAGTRTPVVSGAHGVSARRRTAASSHQRSSTLDKTFPSFSGIYDAALKDLRMANRRPAAAGQPTDAKMASLSG